MTKKPFPVECLRIKWHISTSFYIINAIIMCQERMVSHRSVCQPFPVSMGNVGLTSVHVTITFSFSFLFCSLVNCMWFILIFKSSLSTSPPTPYSLSNAHPGRSLYFANTIAEFNRWVNLPNDISVQETFDHLDQGFLTSAV